MRRRLLIAIIAGCWRYMVTLDFGFCVHCDHLQRRERGDKEFMGIGCEAIASRNVLDRIF
jgi:hypothetical protein